MTRPKDKGVPGVRDEMSQAFQDKSKQELDRLKISVAKGLEDDMRSLLESEMHTDLIITNGNHIVKAHKCILQVRSKYLWQESWCTRAQDDRGQKIYSIQMPRLGREELEAFVRQMYTISDSVLLLEEFVPFLPGGAQSTIDGKSATDSSVSETKIDSEITSEITSDNCNALCLLEDVKSVNMSHGDLNLTTPVVDMDNVMIEASKNRNTEGSNNRNREQSFGLDGCGLAQNDDYAQAYAKKEEKGNKDAGDEDLFYPQENLDPLEKDDTLGFISVAEKNVATETQKYSTEEVAADNVLAYLPFDDNTKASHNTIQNEIDGTSLNTLIGNSEHTLGAQGTPVDEIQSLEQNDEYGQKENTVHTMNGTIHKSEEEKAKVEKSLADAVKSSYSFSIPYETCSPLGKDLLQMFLQEVGCDCCLSVDGVKFLAHKSILSARSEYFQAMMGGQWSESNLEIISLEGVSPSEIEQVLLFLYGGVVELSASHDLMDIFTVADMYGIVSLKTVLAFYVRRDFCHYFHRPCQGCVANAADALSLCHNFNLEDLRLKCLKWISKYFTKIWPTKTFSSLPDSLQQLCIQTIISELNPKNVLDVIMECNKLTSSLPRVKWTESILCLLTQLLDSASEFTSTNFLYIIQTQEFLQWAKVASWKAGALEEIFNSVIDSLSVDTACQVYQKLLSHKTFHSDFENSDPDIIGLLDSMIKRCEKYFKVNIQEVMRSDQWSFLPKSTRAQILETSAYLYFGDSPKPKGKPPPKGAFSKDRPKPVVPKIASLRKPKIRNQKTTRVSENREVKNLANSTEGKESKDVESQNERECPILKTQKDKGRSDTIRKISASSHMLKNSSREPVTGGRDKNEALVESKVVSENKPSVSTSESGAALSQGIRGQKDRLASLQRSKANVKAIGKDNAKVESKTVSQDPVSGRARSEPLPKSDSPRPKTSSLPQRIRHSSGSDSISSSTQKLASKLPIRSIKSASKSRPSSQIFYDGLQDMQVESTETERQMSASLPKLSFVEGRIKSDLFSDFDPPMICESLSFQAATAADFCQNRQRDTVDQWPSVTMSDECQPWSMDKKSQSFSSYSPDPMGFETNDSVDILISSEEFTTNVSNKNDNNQSATVSGFQLPCSADGNSSTDTASNSKACSEDCSGITLNVKMHSEVKIVQTNKPVSIGFIVPPD